MIGPSSVKVGGCPRGVMNCGLEVIEFEFHSRYYVTFPWEKYEIPYPLIYELDSFTAALLQEFDLYAIKLKN